MPKRLLPFIPPSLRVVAVTAEPEHVMVLAVPRSTAPCCPVCRTRSDSVHGTYERHLADLPCQGRSVGLCVRLRRLRCRNPACPRRTSRHHTHDARGAFMTCSATSVSPSAGPRPRGSPTVWPFRLAHPPSCASSGLGRPRSRYRRA